MGTGERRGGSGCRPGRSDRRLGGGRELALEFLLVVGRRRDGRRSRRVGQGGQLLGQGVDLLLLREAGFFKFRLQLLQLSLQLLDLVFRRPGRDGAEQDGRRGEDGSKIHGSTAQERGWDESDHRT